MMSFEELRAPRFPDFESQWQDHLSTIIKTSEEIIDADELIQQRIADLQQALPPGYTPEDLNIITTSAHIAIVAHHGQLRKEEVDEESGEPLPYVMHPFEVASIVAQQRLGKDEEEPPAEAVAAALIHDVPEDCDVQDMFPQEEEWFEALQKLFEHGQGVSPEGVTKDMIRNVRLLQKTDRMPTHPLLRGFRVATTALYYKMNPELQQKVGPPDKQLRHAAEMGFLLGSFFNKKMGKQMVFNEEDRWPLVTKAVDTYVNLYEKTSPLKLYRASVIAAFARYVGAQELAEDLWEKTGELYKSSGLSEEIQQVVLNETKHNLIPQSSTEGPISNSQFTKDSLILLLKWNVLAGKQMMATLPSSKEPI